MALQSKSCDLVEAYKDAQNLVKVLEEVRNDKDRYGRLFTRALQIAATVDVEPSKPRTAERQRGRANAPCSKQYTRILPLEFLLAIRRSSSGAHENEILRGDKGRNARFLPDSKPAQQPD